MFFCPFTVYFKRCFVPSFCGFDNGRKKAELDLFASVFYVSFILFASIYKAYSFVSRFIIALQPSVSVVLGRRGVAQIFPPIISLVFVSVVNFVFWPFSRHPKPDDTMRHIVLTVDAYLDSALKLLGARDSADWRSYGESNFPYQNSHFWVIVKKFSYILSRKIGMRVFVCHVQMLSPEGIIVNAP